MRPPSRHRLPGMADPIPVYSPGVDRFFERVRTLARPSSRSTTEGPTTGATRARARSATSGSRRSPGTFRRWQRWTGGPRWRRCSTASRRRSDRTTPTCASSWCQACSRTCRTPACRTPACRTPACRPRAGHGWPTSAPASARHRGSPGTRSSACGTDADWRLSRHLLALLAGSHGWSCGSQPRPWSSWSRRWSRRSGAPTLACPGVRRSGQPPPGGRLRRRAAAIAGRRRPAATRAGAPRAS
jgi:hypothetical protein